MRPLVYVWALAAALPLWSAAAAPPLSRLAGVDPGSFAIAPGEPILTHQPPQRYFTYAVAPGQTVNDVVAVLNPSRTAPLTVRWSASDARTPSQGAGIVVSYAGPQREIGTWMHIATQTVTVAPNHVTFVPIKVSIPGSVRPGEYQGAISAVDLHPATITQGNLHYKISIRRTLAVVLRVLGPASAGLQIMHPRLVAPDKRAVLALTLKNTGTVIDHPIATLTTFTGPHMSYTQRPVIGALTAGDSTTIMLALGRTIPPATYRLRMQITYLAHLSNGAAAQPFHAEWTGPVTVAAGVGR
jgi:Bacterial protein of unknown function (DUF916)